MMESTSETGRIGARSVLECPLSAVLLRRTGGSPLPLLPTGVMDPVMKFRAGFVGIPPVKAPEDWRSPKPGGVSSTHLKVAAFRL